MRHFSLNSLCLLSTTALMMACTSNLNVQSTKPAPEASEEAPETVTEPVTETEKTSTETESTPIAFHIVASGQTNASAFEVSWEGVELNQLNADKGFLLSLATDDKCTNSIASFEKIQNKKLLLEHLIDGTYYLCLSATDKAGQVHVAENNGLAIVVDRLAPVITLPAGATYHASYSLAATVAELH